MHAAPTAPLPLVPLQQRLGNRAVGRLVQAKLKVARPGDRLEREADRAADQILRRPGGAAPAVIADAATSADVARAGLDGAGGGIFGGTDRGAAGPTPGPAVHAVLNDGGGGNPLPHAARVFFEPRLGADLAAVRVHTGPAAGAATAEIGAKAFTHGQDIYFGRGRFAPRSGEGERLLAHELVHTVQQGGDGGGLIQADFVSDFEGRSETLVSESATAPARTIRLTNPAGDAVWAPYGIYRPSDVPDRFQGYIMDSTTAWRLRAKPGMTASQAIDLERARGANVGELTVRDMTRFAAGPGRDVNVRVMMAKVGNDFRFVGYDRSETSAGGVVQAGFVEAEAGTRLVGQKLFADRVMRALRSAARGMTLEVFLSQRTEDFHARIYQIIGREGRPSERTRYTLTPREMVRVALAWSEDLNMTQRSQLALLASGAPEPTPADVQRALGGGSPAPGQGGGTPPPVPPARGGPSGGPTAPPTTQGASGSGSSARTTMQGGQGGTKPPVSARDMAAEMARTLREAQRLEFATRAVRYGLGAWQAVNVLRDVAKSVNMASAILAQGSPFAAQIRHADTIEATAKEIAQYYGSFDLLDLRIQEHDPSWSSFYDVYQYQLTFLLMEQSFHQALTEVQAARDNIRKQMNALRDEMASKAAAMMFATTSVVHAEVMLFADAGGKINTRLQEAARQYAIAENALMYHRGMARAVAKRHEMRLRELGSSGVFGSIPTNKIRSADLDRFTFRR
jgi:hypothetical protein